jgi:hypothetical protein
VLGGQCALWAGPRSARGAPRESPVRSRLSRRFARRLASQPASRVSSASLTPSSFWNDWTPVPRTWLGILSRRRSPATLPEFHAGRPPRNKGMRYPADPPTIEEIVTVTRHAGDGVHGRATARADRRAVAGRAADLRCAHARRGRPWDPRRGSLLVRHSNGGRRRPHRAAPRRPPGRRTATLCAAPTPPRARRRDGPRGRAADPLVGRMTARSSSRRPRASVTTASSGLNPSTCTASRRNRRPGMSGGQ